MFNSKKNQLENEQLREQIARIKAQQEAALLTREIEITERVTAQVTEQVTEQVTARLTELFQTRTEELCQQHSRELEAVQLEMKLLIERVFGSKSERYIDNPRQLKLDLGINDEQVDDAVEGLQIAVDEINDSDDSGSSRPKRKTGKRDNKKFPQHLERTIVNVDFSDDKKEGLQHIGFDPVEKLHMSPPRFWVTETRYHKYVVAKQTAAIEVSTDQVDSSEVDTDQAASSDAASNDASPEIQATAVLSPARPEGGLVRGDHYDTSIAAEIITNRFGYHLPFYRQQDIFAVSGWTPSRSTLQNIQASSAIVLHDFASYLADLVRTDAVLGTDDTGVKLLLPKSIPELDTNDPKSARAVEVITAAIEQQQRNIGAKFWAYRGSSIPINVFDFTVSRHRDGPDLFLIDSNYKGTILGDCYGANTGIAMRSSGDVAHAACVSHARRHVRDAMSTHQRHGQALMKLFQQLYDIEDRGACMDAAALLELRQSEAVAVWNELRDYIALETLDLLPKEKMKKALNYIHNQWDALTEYLRNPLISIDNNETEQLMKQVAVGRKNWLFVGSLTSGYQMADLMTIVSSAIRNDLHVSHYVKDLLDAMLAGSKDYDSLRPDVWGESHPEHRRAYRAEEREARHHRKQERRSKLRRQQPSVNRLKPHGVIHNSQA